VKRLQGPIGSAALMAAVVLAPFVFSHYRLYQLGLVAVYLVALLGLDMLTGFTGQISLGHGAFMGIGAYTTTILVVDHGWRDLWTIPVAGLVAGGCGLLFGLPATRFAGPYLALATFAIPLSFIGILKRFPHFTGGNVGKNLPQLHAEFGLGINPSVWFYVVAWAVALVMLPLAYVVVRGRFGRALRAVRDSEIASTAYGVSTAAIKAAAFGISAFYCGIAGGLFAIGITYVSPDTFPIALSILLLTGIVIGGAGSLYGMVFGAVFVEFIQISWSPALLEQISRIHHIDTRAPGSGLVVYGLILLAVLYVAPAGIAGLARRLRTVLLNRTYSSYSHRTNPQVTSKERN
jgi:branched-chain amino acid transport system permease protein